MHVNSIPSISLDPTHDSARVNHIEDDHHRKHEQGIEDVEISLVVKQGAVAPLKVLHHPEDRPHHDQSTGPVQRPHVLFPGIGAARLDRRNEDQSAVEADGDDHEEAEEGELHEEADYDDVGAQF